MTNDKQRVDFPVGENVSIADKRSTPRGRLVELINNKLCATTTEIETIADQLLANGVIVPPVKYGDTLYIITEVSKAIVETIVIGVWIYEESFTVLTIHGNILNDSFGKTVFLSKEEALEALKGGVQG